MRSDSKARNFDHRHRFAFLTLLLALLGCEPRPPQASHPEEVASCNPTNATILGDWARAKAHYVDAQGHASPARGWRTELWLPESSYRGGCWFSCASSYLSAAAIADGPATFVQLIHETEGARPLNLSNATLSVAGAAPLSQTAMRNNRFDPYEANAYHESYFFAFPPTNPPTWEYLEATFPIEDSTDHIRVRFVRQPARD